LEFQLKLDLPLQRPAIRYPDKIMLIGSCFTEHIGKRLEDIKFEVCSNPHGILFNPLSVCNSLNRYIEEQLYEERDLFYLNELWNNWAFHTRFSDTDPVRALKGMNDSLVTASAFIRDAGWLIITLGSSYQYFLKEDEGRKSPAVANCHRAPGQWFEKKLLGIEEVTDNLIDTINAVRSINPGINVIFTISPVRHIRDGIVNNNRSKARLIEAVHDVVARMDYCSYFPAYELIIDVLRDYRFYDIDMVHPNYPATQFVWEHFSKTYFEEDTAGLARQLADIHIAANHKPRFPDTEAHRRFMDEYAKKIGVLETLHPHLDLSKEKSYFKIK